MPLDECNSTAILACTGSSGLPPSSVENVCAAGIQIPVMADYFFVAEKQGELQARVATSVKSRVSRSNFLERKTDMSEDR